MPRKTAAPSRAHRPRLCFNEAAARCRGKRATAAAPRFPAVASMRPRPDAAENGGSWRRRGARPHACFNEAAARCRGKPGGRFDGGEPGAPASMRPRPDAAENVLGRPDWPAGRVASMRPRPDAAENAAVAPGTTLADVLQ